jgi:hypothetical protein
MAKIQGHFLKYRENTDLAIKNYAEVMDECNSITEMSVNEWLHRLNLHKYQRRFNKNRLISVSDLRHCSDDMMEKDCKVKKKHLRDRMREMIESKKIAKEDFELKSKQQTR